jgi:hypothetical protein
LLEQLPECKAIAVFGVGTDRIDLKYTAAHDIQVSITRDILTDDVADLALTLTLAFSRNLVAYHQFAKSGAWENNGVELSSRASGKRIGIAGLGAIGLAIARRAEAFGMEVAYTARSAKDVSYKRCDTIEQLATFSDFLVLALPGSKENVQLVNAKVLAAHRHGLVPVVCVGETAEDLEQHGASAVPVRQLRAALEGVDGSKALVVAYEPVWAIGSGQAATPEQAEKVAAALRDVIAELLGQDVADATRILYGGSVKATNIASFLREPNVDGALVGGASLDIEEFTSIVRFKKHVGA